jgi:hypothetical protein
MFRWASRSRSLIGSGSGANGQALAMPWWGMLVEQDLEPAQPVQQASLAPVRGTVQQLAAAGPHPALHDRICAGRLDAAEHDPDTGVGEDGVECGRVPAVPIADRYFNRHLASSMSITRFRAACVTHAAVGSRSRRGPGRGGWRVR